MRPFLLITVWLASRYFIGHVKSFDHSILYRGFQDEQDGLIGVALK